MSISARLLALRGAFELDLELEAGVGETLALIGPSGSGKTTAVRVLAGVDGLDGGFLRFGDEVWDMPETGVAVPAERRSVGWVPQGRRLFEHLDAAGNVAFGLRSRGWTRRRARVEGEAWLERVGLGGRGRARVGELSGGEAQRVALARALAARPRVLLLDEPFAGLDVAARVTVRRVVREALAGVEAVRIVVAHEPVDALALADRLVVVEEGRATQTGTPADLCERPAGPYVAELAGVNLLRGRGSDAAGHPAVEVAGGGSLHVAERVEGDVLAVFRPSAVAVYRDPPAGSPRNVFAATVVEVAPSGERMRVRLDGPPAVVAELTAEAAAALALRPGDRVYAVIKATEIDVSPR